MPKYFFHIRHISQDLDQDGVDLPDIHAAWQAATMSAGDHLKELDGALKPGQDWCMCVTDDSKRTLFEIHVKPKANVSMD